MLTSELIQSLQKAISERELSKLDYDTVEIVVDLRKRDERRLRLNFSFIATKDGNVTKKPFPMQHDEYKKLFTDYEDLEVLRIQISEKEILFSANIEIEEHGIKRDRCFEFPLEFMQEELNPCMEDDCTYVSYFHKISGNRDYTTFFNKHINGIKQKDDGKKIDNLNRNVFISSHAKKVLSRSFSNNAKTLLVAEKDQAIVVKELSTAELVAGIKTFYDGIFLGKKYSLNATIEFREADSKYSPIEIITEGTAVINGETSLLANFPMTDFFLVYEKMERSNDFLNYTIQNDELNVYAEKGFPEFGIQEKSLIVDLEPTDLEAICSYIESGNEDKLKKAIEACLKNDGTRVRIEKRYLEYIKAQTKNPKASLEDIKVSMFSSELQDYFLGHRAGFGKDFVSFGYSSKEESKRIIDFIGSLVKYNLDYTEFASSIDVLYDSTDNFHEIDPKIRPLHKAMKNKFATAIEEEIELYSAGFWSKALRKILDLKLTKIHVEKSRFFEREELPVLEEYMFYLVLAAGEKSFYLDISNGEMHDLTSMFWRFQFLPAVIWFQSEPSYPKYIYSRPRVLEAKVDNGSYTRIDVLDL